MSRKRVSAEEIINKLHEEEIFDTITQARVVTERWCNTYNKISSGLAKTDGLGRMRIPFEQLLDASESGEKGHGSDYPPTAILKKTSINRVVLFSRWFLHDIV